MTALEIVQCSPALSVQDAGRFGYRRFGVSTSGAMDRQSLALANTLVGNRPDAAALEMPLSGATFRVAGGPVLVAVSGPVTQLTVSGRSVPRHSSVLAVDGEIIVVGAPRDGVYGYLAVAGGIRTAPVLGSRSFHRRSGIGGGILSPGDRLPCGAGSPGTPLFFPETMEYGCGDDAVRIVAGPQADFFEEGAWSGFLSARYRISARSDRMGLRLDGPGLKSAKGHDILSEGVAPGSIQVPGDGHPIVLGRDCQTTGGYPKIATVISSDLDRLAQIPSGQEVRFQLVSLADAKDAARRAARWINALKDAVKPVGASSIDLHTHNLISGVTKGDEF